MQLFGDMPIFIAHDSADVWSQPSGFRLDVAGNRVVVAGAPPDYFSQTGQRWGNPHYDWTWMEQNDFHWWRMRIAWHMQMFDMVRIDHFRGFEASWEIPVHEATAINSRWVKAPGEALFNCLLTEFGKLAIVAEDLGIITPEVEALRDHFGLPGMRILHFAFDSGASNPYLPHNHVPNSVVYTGTHDNDTTNGWFHSLHRERQRRILHYFGEPQEEMPWSLILFYGTFDMPALGDPAAPAHHHVAPRYVEDSGTEIGIPNVVTSVLASYRGYDTMGETSVILTAGIGVLLLLKGRRRDAESGR